MNVEQRIEADTLIGRLKEHKRSRRNRAALNNEIVLPHYDVSIDVGSLVPKRETPAWITERQNKRTKHEELSSNSLVNKKSFAFTEINTLNGKKRCVDHYNIRKDLKSKNRVEMECEFMNQIHQQNTPDPIRPYPYATNRNKYNLLYASDLKENSILVSTQVEDSYIDIFAEQQDRIRLDNSELSLEVFDSLEFEEQDLSPESWTLCKRRAKVPYYTNHSWIWTKCTVTGYDQSTNRFNVIIGADNRTKLVKRLNILFDDENEDLWNKRRASAEEYRKQAKKRLRFDHFLQYYPLNTAQAMQESMLCSIHYRVFDGVLHASQLIYEPKFVNLNDEIKCMYARTVKKAAIFHLIKCGNSVKDRYTELDLPLLPSAPPIKQFGKISMPEYPFRTRKKIIRHIHVTSIHQVMSTLLWLHVRWNTVFHNCSFVDEALKGIIYPCDLEIFKDAQLKCCLQLHDKLQQEWRKSFLEQITDSFQEVFDFFQSDLRLYRKSVLYRLLLHLHFRMSFQLRELFSNSLANWRNFITKHTPEKSLLDQTNFVSSLLKIELKVSENSELILEPNREEIEKLFIGVVDTIVTSIKGLSSLDTDLLTLISLPHRSIFEIHEGNIMYVDVEADLENTYKFVKEQVTCAMKDANEVLDRYEKFMYLMEPSSDELLDSSIQNNSSIDLDLEYLEKANQLQIASEEVSMLSSDFEKFLLVEVNTTASKSALLSQAKSKKYVYLEAIANRSRERTNNIIFRFQEILERISEKPKNEMELSALKDYIVESKSFVSSLLAEGKSVSEQMAALDQFNYPLCNDDMKLFLKTLEYPALIEEALVKANQHLGIDKARMMEQLAMEKLDFQDILNKFESDVARAKILGDFSQAESNTDYVNKIQEAIDDAKRRVEDYNKREKVFGFPPTDYPILRLVEKELEPFFKLWNMISDFLASQKEWLHGSFLSLKYEQIEKEVLEWWRTSYQMSKSLEESFPEAAACASKLREETSEFKLNLPLVQTLASPALKPRHWTEFTEKTGAVIEPDEELTLAQLVQSNVLEHIEIIQEVCASAEKEYGLEKVLTAMKEEWQNVELEIKPYKNTGTFLISGVDELLVLLEDHIVKTQTMRGSPYIKPIEKECRAWETRLKYAQGLIDEWVACQRTWLYLEPIFSSEDIVRQLPTEARRFNGVDLLWRKTMEEAKKDPNLMAQADPDKKLEEKFKAANQKLEEIQKGLTDYLEMKRLYFPRFFFLSNDELLEILSETKEPRAVQPHLNKAFEGIAKCKFQQDLKITEMISAEGEVVVLNNFVDPESSANKGCVERWLLELEAIQWASIRSKILTALDQYSKNPREKWVLEWPAQVVLAVTQVFWTQEVTDAITKGYGSLKKLENKLTNQLRSITMAVRGQLTDLQRKTLSALCTIDVHARDTVTKMVEANVDSEDHFEWMSQLRYYWSSSWKDGQAVKSGENTLVARICNAKCLYGYEYLGNTSRLVITPLTDRCYRTMIGAIDLFYGGAPEGPAGTGKTETVKDLSKAVAIQCVVFNCSDGLDYLAMAKFFKGLAGCGSWCCFDEFNRINIEVLSVIAQQILTINKAKRAGLDKFHFEGTYMKINSNANAFITMNPGYAGRAELPDNLKALFRPCAMMVPDYALIAEIRLYSFGFENARENAQKLVRVLQLSSEQLSSQKHYDYGMRAVNSILVAAGNLRQKNGDNPLWTEEKIVLRSINDVNVPKFTVEDIPLFRGITSDLFPGVELGKSDHTRLLEALDSVCKKGITIAPSKPPHKLKLTSSWMNKVAQLYEMVLVRHGVMVVGETGSGKTCIIHALANAMTEASLTTDNDKRIPAIISPVQVYTLNPKSLSSGQLYGNFDENTHEWSDGILAVIYRNCAKDPSPDRKWVLFDGPVDAVWIENMNTVLDDNKKLCLMSGEIIKMSDSMTMMFEAEDLDQASPATVSRVGMIFCEVRNLGWMPLCDIWIERLPQSLQRHSQFMKELFSWLFPPAVYFVLKYCKIPTPVTSQELASSLIRLYDVLIDFSPESVGDIHTVLESLFVVALFWSVGGCIDAKGRQQFHHYMVHLMRMKGKLPTGPPEYIDFISKHRDWSHRQSEKPIKYLPLFENGSILYDFKFDLQTCLWLPWLNALDEICIPQGAAFHSIVVPTLDTVRHESMIDALLTHGHHVLCCGDTGTGKSVSIKTKLKRGMPPNFMSIMMNFSAQTSANQTQDLIDSKLDKRRKGVLGPPLGTNCVIFVDDLNMPAKEKYGAQPPIELLRQWMDHGGWYARKENTFRQLVDIQFIAAMGPPGGGRTRITQRYVRHFSLINFVPFSEDSLKKVFGSIIEWFLQGKNFNDSIKSIGPNTVSATIGIYKEISENLLPTPAKSHYTFNLRDLSKVFQGLLEGNPGIIVEKEQFIRLWSHECMRVFRDRLVDASDNDWFQSMLSDKVMEHFNTNWMSIKGSESSLIYGKFGDSKEKNCIYRELNDRCSLLKVMEDYLDDYNAMASKPMALVLFENAIEHIARISRIINQPLGHALLVGMGGSGRKSLTKLAVSITDYKLFQIEISKSYGVNEWREDLKKVFCSAGAQNNCTVFLVDDTQIIAEAFLEDINGILNTGEVPNLFTNEDFALLQDDLAKLAQSNGVICTSPSEYQAYFFECVRTNLHVVLCLSPIGEAFRTRLRMFPALVNCCTIDWFSAWPNEALHSVAKHFLDTVELDISTREGIIKICVDMQQRVSDMTLKYKNEMNQYFYVTPTSYLKLISTFQNLLHRQQGIVLEKKERYDNGLLKLAHTELQVEDMQQNLQDLKPQLVEATIETDALLLKISQDTEIANKNKALVEAEEKICSSQAEEARSLKESCEADLAEALPAMEAAITALKSLSKGDIVEVKVMKKPPKAVKMVMESVCLMMNIKPDKIKDPDGGTKKVDDYWGPSQKHLLGDPRFLQTLLDYDKDNMDSSMIQKIKVYTENPDFDPEKVAYGSVAAAGLCKWVHAMVVYDRVVRIVGPKRIALALAETTLNSALFQLAEKQAILKELLNKLALLQTQLQVAEERKAALQDQITDCMNKLRRAEQLISGLGSEKASWGAMSAQLMEKYDNITGDIMLSSGVIAYLGAFTSPYRESAIKAWSSMLNNEGISCSKKFSLEGTLGDPVCIRNWVIAKLPNDSFSIDNAIILTESNRWPLMIDPQSQANKWIKRMEEKNLIKVIKQNQANFIRTIENAMQFGIPVLLENILETLDPILEPVLLKQVVTVGGIATIRIGDSTVEYDHKFKFYMTTKLKNPHYPPELCVKVNLLNFMATEEGLEDQMLGIVVAKEEPELELKRKSLILEDSNNRHTQKQVEDTILDLLRNSKGNILDDEVLIDTLAQSKLTSSNIQRKLKEAAKTQEVIAKTRKGYVPVAFRASQLFFCISDLSRVDPMYQYSLEWFISLFEAALCKASEARDNTCTSEAKIEALNDCFTHLLYLNVCRSLFEKDKLIFSFLLTIKILCSSGKLDSSEFNFFLQGTNTTELEKPNPARYFLPDRSWTEILALSRLKSMAGFDISFEQSLVEWETVFSSNNPEAQIQTLAGKKYNKFQQLCILRALRPDMVVPGVVSFVTSEMGQKFVQPSAFNLLDCYRDSNCCTPLIFVLTPGADPISELLRVADELGFGGKRFTSISLGQGQGPLAENAITEAAENGWWVCLQNCHLSISWMPTLERICEELSVERVHSSFRLWLTSEPSPHFPPFILQNGVKMTNEPPKGMRANLLGSLTSIDPVWFDGCKRPHQFYKLVFGLCFFHAIVRERRKFGPLGWNIHYVFSGPDLKISMDQLRIYLDNLQDNDPVPYSALAYLAGECNYGGRVTDDKDRRCLVNILSDFYCHEIQDDSYRFSDSGTYFAPKLESLDSSKRLESMIEYVRGLPYTEAPEVFGLHDNANISCALAETNCLLETALNLQSHTNTSSGKSWSDTISEIAQDTLTYLPKHGIPAFDIEQALLDFPVIYSESMNTVLTQELMRFNNLVNTITSSLVTIQSAVKGLLVMSSELEELGNSMITGKVPTMWANAAYPSLKPLGSWITDLVQRLEFLQTWVTTKKAPCVFWISGFFFTQAFITGTLQNFARKNSMPIDQVVFDFIVLNSEQEERAKDQGAEEGAFIRGLYMEGARWSIAFNAITESLPRELYTEMPIIHLYPRHKNELLKVNQVYECPVYKTSVRQGMLSTTGHSTNFVMFINLPIQKKDSQKHWIKRGVAMLSQLNF